MSLVDDGQIALSDPIAKYFPEAPVSWRGSPSASTHAYVRIPDYFDDRFDSKRDWSEDDFARLAFGLTLEFTPGSRWNYSNTGYVLLGIIIRKATGRFWGDVLRERVFVPLGMTTARHHQR